MATEAVQLANFSQQRASIRADISIASAELNSLLTKIQEARDQYQEDLLLQEESLESVRRTTNQIKAEGISVLKEIEDERSSLNEHRSKTKSHVEKEMKSLNEEQKRTARLADSATKRFKEVTSLCNIASKTLEDLRGEIDRSEKILTQVHAQVRTANDTLKEFGLDQKKASSLLAETEEKVKVLKQDQSRLDALKTEHEGRIITLKKKEENFAILVRRLQKKYKQVYPGIEFTL